MTAETLHDAISLLPSDLIAEADKKRCARPKIIPWRRYAAMAACFALVLSYGMFAMQFFAPMGGSKECAVEAAPMEQEAPAAAAPMEEEAATEAPAVNKGASLTEDSAARGTFGIQQQCVQTPLKPSTACFSSSTGATLVCSRQELDSYLTEKDWIYDFTDFQAGCEGYDDAWFENYDLLLLTVHAAHPDSLWAITAIEDVRETDPMGWDWFVYFGDHANADTGGEDTAFHLLAELDKGMISPEDSILTVAEVPEESYP